jgi:ElaB/YqjD/DUF883 family membrane-anchored ribosome-binding protein
MESQIPAGFRDAGERAGSYVQQTIEDLLDRARALTGDADGWIADLREMVRAHPLQALAATIGIGYVIGKLARRR